MNGKEKSTLLLSMLGPQLSSAVLRRLPEAHARRLATAISNLPAPNPDLMPHFFTDIERQIAAIRQPAKEERMPETPAVAVPSIKAEDIHRVSDLTPAMLWEALASEKPQTVAFFVNHLEEQLREALVAKMPKEIAQEVSKAPLIDNEFSRPIFEDLSRYVVQFWQQKLNPQGHGAPALA